MMEAGKTPMAKHLLRVLFPVVLAKTTENLPLVRKQVLQLRYLIPPIEQRCQKSAAVVSYENDYHHYHIRVVLVYANVNV